MEKRTKQLLIGGIIVVAAAVILLWFFKTWTWSNEPGSGSNWFGFGKDPYCKLTGTC